MKRARLVFLLVACVALAWTAWLAYMVATAADPVVVSAPQVHLASLVLAGQVSVNGEIATVKTVKVFKDEMQPARQKPLPEEITVVKWQADYPGSGQTLLLTLLKQPGDVATYELAPIPMPQGLMAPRVYPYSDSVRIQVERILQK